MAAPPLRKELIKNLTDEDEVTVRRKLRKLSALEFSKNILRMKSWSGISIPSTWARAVRRSECVAGLLRKNVEDLTLCRMRQPHWYYQQSSIYDPYINFEKISKGKETILRKCGSGLYPHSGGIRSGL